jgi:hypothetical protein
MAEKQTPPAAQYVVLHGMVGAYYGGQTITAEDLGADEREITRLVDMGAIAPAGSRAAGDKRSDLGADATTPEGDRVDDPAAVARQSTHARAARTPPPKDDA